MERHEPVNQVVRLFDRERQSTDCYSFDRAPYTLGYPIYSACFVCPICRQLWAEIEVNTYPVYQPRGVSCEQCNYMGPYKYEWLSTIPGSLLDNGIICPDGVDWSMLEGMPKALIEREFRLTLKAFDKYPQAFRYLEI
jgi:hypothetical protein